MPWFAFGLRPLRLDLVIGGVVEECLGTVRLAFVPVLLLSLLLVGLVLVFSSPVFAISDGGSFESRAFSSWSSCFRDLRWMILRSANNALETLVASSSLALAEARAISFLESAITSDFALAILHLELEIFACSSSVPTLNLSLQFSCLRDHRSTVC